MKISLLFLLIFCSLFLQSQPFNVSTSETLLPDSLLAKFRHEYQRLNVFVEEAIRARPDTFLLEMLGEELDGLRVLVSQVFNPRALYEAYI